MSFPTKADIQKVIKKDKMTCKILYEKYKSIGYGICLRYAKKRADAKDMLQEGFVEVFKSISTYKYAGSFEGWLRKIIVRKAIAYAKKHYKITYSSLDHDLRTSNPEILDQFDADPILEIINQLPEHYRIIFNLRAIEQMSSKEVAALLNIKEDTVRSQFHRAKNKVKAALQNQDFKEKNRLNYGS